MNAISTPPQVAPRILIAEDDPLASDLLRVTLELHSFEVDTAQTGIAAVEMWGKKHYDLIMMDIQMPKMDGVTATREIRKREREVGGHTPIVAVTAHSFSEDQEKCMEAGMDAYITKPLDIGKGIEVVMGFITKQRAV